MIERAEIESTQGMEPVEELLDACGFKPVVGMESKSCSFNVPSYIGLHLEMQKAFAGDIAHAWRVVEESVELSSDTRVKTAFADLKDLIDQTGVPREWLKQR